MSIETRIAADERDTVVVYDVMREAANQLVAEWLSRSTNRGGPVPSSEVREQIAHIRDEVHEIPTRDFDAIVAATTEFRHRRDALAA